MTKRILRNTLMLPLGALLLFLSSAKQDEGMFPLSFLGKLDLQKAGMRIPVRELFSPGEVSLTNALVQVDGCTGSFISNEGLVITNHHCVFSTVSNMSTPENNLLENGFKANEKSQELRTGKTCRITDSYEDVSLKVLKGVGNVDPLTRSNIIQKNVQAILAEEKAKAPNLTIEISEMLTGKSYTLFRYITLRDVRLVYVPPRTVGEFGGESDNWVWPRHNGDFSLLRAYVDKNGNPAPFSPDNVPYKPARFLKVNANGTKEGDFVFVMGYPGRTFRHMPGKFVDYQHKIYHPFVAEWNQWKIDLMEDLGKNNLQKSLKFAGPIQGLSNTAKNFRGKIQGLTRTHLADTKLSYDAALAEKIKNDPGSLFHNLFTQINANFDKKSTLGLRNMTVGLLWQDVPWFDAAYNITKYKSDYLKVKKTKDTAQMRLFLKQLEDNVFADYRMVDTTFHLRVLEQIIIKLKALPASQAVPQVAGIVNPADWVKKFAAKTKFFNPKYFRNLIKTKPDKYFAYTDQFVKMMAAMVPLIDEIDEFNKNSSLELQSLMPQYLDAKMTLDSSSFVPDANSTLRLTYGNVKGFSPDDAVYNEPYTSLDGIFNKANTSSDYRLPDFVKEKLQQKNVPVMFKDPKTGKVVVAFLYNLDTTGGNSGSPVLDADGNLVGVNFDRAYTATINDYAWNQSYSRSIGVDIRYVVYILKYVSGADHLISEMGVTVPAN